MAMRHGVVLALIAMILAPSHAAAQGVTSPYLALVWRYRAGDTLGAVQAMSALSRSGLRTRVLRDLGPLFCEMLAKNRDCERLRERQRDLYRTRVAPLLQAALPAAVLLHLHTSMLFDATDDTNASAAHREIARALLARMAELEPELGANSTRFRQIRRRTHLLLIWRGQQEIAVSEVESDLRDARRAFPDDVDLALAGGWVEETLAQPAMLQNRYNSRVTQATTTSGRRDWSARERAFRLGRAERLYRDVLATDSGSLEGRVRLARILTLQDRLDEARTLLTLSAADERGDRRFRYLAALFAAGVDERAQRPAAARRHYETALRLWPGGQSARIALARLLATEGERARASSLVQMLPPVPPVIDGESDPWWWYALGQSWRMGRTFSDIREDLHR
jgi:tetratricopeptide (TPR) repeat protein